MKTKIFVHQNSGVPFFRNGVGRSDSDSHFYKIVGIFFMAYTVYPLNNADFLVWLINFIAIATANKTALDLSDTQIGELTDLQTFLETKINNNQAKHET